MILKILWRTCLLSMLVFANYAVAVEASRKNVLVLYTYGTYMASNIIIERGIKDTFKTHAVELYREYMDLRRVSSEAYLERLKQSYARKYAQRKIDAIIVVMAGALDFIRRYGETLFPGVPVVFCALSQPELNDRQLPPNIIGVPRNFDFKGTLELMLRLHPETRHVVVAAHTEYSIRSMLKFVRESFAPFESQLEFTYYPEQSLEIWQNTLANLPPHSIIFYVKLWKDPAGNRFPPVHALHFIALNANAPIYGIFDTYIGHGIVGGHLDSYEVQGQTAAQLIVRIFAGEKPQDISVNTMTTNVNMFYWPQLKRWNIPESRLPANSIIKDKPPSIWEAYKWWIISGIAVLVTESLLIIMLLIHRTVRFRAEQELQKYRRHLEKLVEERTAELVDSNKALTSARDRAEIANQTKSTFLASMSHELRTPLNGILGYAQILQRDLSITTRQQHGLSVIEQSGDHLLNLINDVLDLAKVESGKIELYQIDFNLPLFLNGVSEIIKIRARHKGIDFDLKYTNELPNGVHGDERRLRQILLNLLGNAVKFTDEGRVTLEVESEEYKGEHIGSLVSLSFKIEDTGLGISPENLESIFEPFKQVGEQERQTKGTGLGLAISNNLVELMGGQLNVSSQINVGTQFRFEITLPIVGYNFAKVSTQRPIIGIKGESSKILVVDDNLENQAVVVDLLSPLGFEVKTANGGYQGLEQAIKWQPDVIIADLIMPEIDGFELIRQLRQSPILKEKIIIASSASVYEEDKKRSSSVGSDAFLPKPIQIATLLEQLQYLLNLTWIYGDKMPETVVENNATNMVLPPVAELEKLYELSLMGNVNKIKEQVAILADYSDAKLKPFITQMQVFLKNCQMKKLLKWLEEVMKND